MDEQEEACIPESGPPVRWPQGSELITVGPLFLLPGHGWSQAHKSVNRCHRDGPARSLTLVHWGERHLLSPTDKTEQAVLLGSDELTPTYNQPRAPGLGDAHWPDQEAVPGLPAAGGQSGKIRLLPLKKGVDAGSQLRAQFPGAALAERRWDAPCLSPSLSFLEIYTSPADSEAEKCTSRANPLHLQSHFSITHWGTGYFQQTPSTQNRSYVWGTLVSLGEVAIPRRRGPQAGLGGVLSVPLKNTVHPGR